MDHVDVAARDLVNRLERRHLLVEAGIAGLEAPRVAAHPEREPIRHPIANHTRVDQPIADRQAARAGRISMNCFARRRSPRYD